MRTLAQAVTDLVRTNDPDLYKGERGVYYSDRIFGPDPRKVDTSGASYAALVSIAEVSVSKTSGATRLHQECRRRVL